MANLILDPDEYMVEDPVPRYGSAQDYTVKFLLGPLIVVVTIFICWWLPKVFSQFVANPTLAKEPVYCIIGYAYIPLSILFVLLYAYYFLSIYREKVMLTNKAILRRDVFSIDRIPFAEITAVEVYYESFNFNQKAQVNSFVLGVLLGVNWQMEIRATANRALIIRNMAKSNARALKAQLDAVCSESTTP